MSSTSNTKRKPSLRTKLLALLGSTLLLFLAACGAKIDTILTFNAEGGGTREITLSFEQDETTADYITGGIAAVEASIKKHAPQEIEFLSLTEEGATATAKFVIKFENIDEYQTKTKALLAAGNSTWNDSNVQIFENNELLNGVAIEEWFSSQHLMDWMFNGLVADKIVAEENRSSMSEDGNTTVIFGDQKESVYANIDFDAITDLGFDAITMETDVSVTPMTRSIKLWVSDRSRVIAHQDTYDQFFNSITTDEVAFEVDTQEAGHSWNTTFSGEAEYILETTSTILNSDNVVFNLKTEPSTHNPAVMVTSVNNFADCTSICSRDAEPVSDSVKVPEGPKDAEGNQDSNAVEVTFYSLEDNHSITFETVANFSEVAYLMDLTPQGNASFEATFIADKAIADQFDEGFKSLIKGDSEVEVATKEGDDQVVYTVNLAGDSTQDLMTQYNTWSNTDSAIAEYESPENSFFIIDFRFEGYFELPNRFSQNLPLEGAPVLTITSGGRTNFVADGSYSDSLISIEKGFAKFNTESSVSLSLQSSGRTLGGIILLAIIGLAVVAGGIALTIFIKKNKAVGPTNPHYSQHPNGTGFQPTGPTPEGYYPADPNYPGQAPMPSPQMPLSQPESFDFPPAPPTAFGSSPEPLNEPESLEKP
ncbi:hypothetical protein V5R04_09035 [Jonesiaceae bacterium BS-20]|uniref:Uncharacterized protein n=1 Tax=Jonesiaceae bacterium BS-20 TaxID=3120821 RepID=A0AAU7DSV8_9MICO